ncbi:MULTISPECIES: helix-turn-helix domain-containing protein [Vibrio]|uniref:helix-turn-helix domain-containing protein n=1 Tax=Vibrio TaxID=662 RepID=UPI000B5C35A8|nr:MULTISPECIES: S24 family peptidase [Vibrio]HBV77627.1 transcriptional regulator [Vibrio sp.]
MKEWFLSTELVDIRGVPNSPSGIAQQARRHDWKTRKAKGNGRALEYHISNFNKDVIAQLREKFGEVGEGDVHPIQSNVKKVQELDTLDVTPIPVYNVYAACGFGSVIDTEYQIRTTYLPTETLARFGVCTKTARIITCDGDSMEDTLSDGDEVLVDIRELDHPVKNGVYVIRIGKHVFIKRLKYNILAESYDVISDNTAEYDPFTLTKHQLEDFAIEGKVLTVVMKRIF